MIDDIAWFIAVAIPAIVFVALALVALLGTVAYIIDPETRKPMLIGLTITALWIASMFWLLSTNGG